MKLLLMFSVIAGMWDFTVRNVDAFWTENFVSQLAVFFSPLIYFALLTTIFIRFKDIPSRAPQRYINYASVALVIISAIVFYQIYFNGGPVGSAYYSVVQPLYVSGIPFSLLTFFVYFGSDKDYLRNRLLASICVFWLITPAAIDTLYTYQGGYRGSLAHFEVPVLGTTYDFIQGVVAFPSLLAPFIALAVIIGFGHLIYKSQPTEKLPAFAVGCSMLTLTYQILNWGGFVLD